MQEEQHSAIETMSSFILSEENTSDELTQASTIEDKEGKLELLKNIQNTRHKITSELSRELDKLSNGKVSNQNSVASSSLETVERLLEFKKKVDRKIAEQVDLKRKREEKELKVKPALSSGTKKLIKGKAYIPIYSKERLQEIESTKIKKMEKLRQEVNEKRRQAEEESIANSIPSYKGSEITNIELCFDPSAIKPMLYQSPNANAKQRITSEEEELKRCSFKPKLDKRSDMILSQTNYCNKTVIERLTNKCKQEPIKENSVPVKTQVKKRNERGKMCNTKPEETNIDDFVKLVLAQVEHIEDDKERSNISVINKYLE